MNGTPAKALRLQDGDLLIFETDQRFTPEQTNWFHESVHKGAGKNIKVMLLGPGLRLSEIHTAQKKIASAVREAVSAERERCAKLCDEHAQSPYTNKSRKAAAKFLALEIRNGATES
jgi:hypothetical protein